VAKKPRDYAAERARRKALERQRARAEGRPYEPSRARGHGPQTRSRAGKSESQARAEREAALKESIGALTSAERATIRRFARKVADRNGLDPDDAVAELLEWSLINGFEKFQTEKEFIEGLGMQGMSMAEIEFRSASGDGFPDPRMYWYRRREQMKGREWTPRTPTQRTRRRTRERRARRASRKRKAA
jgi:hypothetical protein